MRNCTKIHSMPRNCDSWVQVTLSSSSRRVRNLVRRVIANLNDIIPRPVAVQWTFGRDLRSFCRMLQFSTISWYNTVHHPLRCTLPLSISESASGSVSFLVKVDLTPE